MVVAFGSEMYANVETLAMLPAFDVGRSVAVAGLLGMLGNGRGIGAVSRNLGFVNARWDCVLPETACRDGKCIPAGKVETGRGPYDRVIEPELCALPESSDGRGASLIFGA